MIFKRSLKKTILFFPLRLKIFIGFITMLVLIILFIFIYYPYIEKKYLNEELNARYHRTAEMIAFGVGAGIQTNNLQLIQESLNLAQKNSDLVFIAAIDNDGKIYGMYNPLNLNPLTLLPGNDNRILTIHDKPYYFVGVPILYNGSDYGTINLVSSLRNHYILIHKSIWSSFIISILLFMAGITISYFFIKSVTKPLSHLQKAAEQISTGNYDVQIPIDTEDEIGFLVKSFRKMKETIQELIKKLNEEILLSKKAGDAMRDNETHLRTLLNTIPDMVWLKDVDGIYLSCNLLFEQFFGAKESEIVGKTDFNFCERDLAEFFRENDRKAMQAGKPTINEEWVTFASDGHRALLETIKTPMMNSKGELIGVLGISHDITKRKQSEEEISRQNEELVKINAEKDKFFSIIAHDLKNPFNSIIGFSKLLVDEISENNYDEIDKYAQIILQSSERAMDLLMNLMEWSRSQTGRIEFKPEVFNLDDVIREVVLLFTHMAGQKSIKLNLDLFPSTLVKADKAMIGTVLRNLISNAIKFTKNGGQITVSTKKNKDNLIISIIDTGVGIPQNAIDKLFRLDSNYTTQGTQKEEGTGLGLILSREFVEKHKGKIWVESEEGKGSIFHFTIPLFDQPL